jgi:hypothetical protein
MTGRLVALLVAVALAASACGGSSPVAASARGREIGALELPIPTRVAALKVTEESIEDVLEESRRPYLEAAGLYAFREEDDLLQATLQVGRFADDVDVDDEEFRDLLINNIGQGAQKVRMGSQDLFLTGADRQTLTVWFDARHLFILSTRDGFEHGRALLRAVLDLELVP